MKKAASCIIDAACARGRAHRQIRASDNAAQAGCGSRSTERHVCLDQRLIEISEQHLHLHWQEGLLLGQDLAVQVWVGWAFPEHFARPGQAVPVP